VGIPGTGKTTAIEEILQAIYPQVISHQSYDGRQLSVSQVVWLMIGCPYDGSIRGLCMSFFQALDNALQQNPAKGYLRLYGKGKRSVDELTLDMATLAGIHGLGVLVVDEVQHLSTAGIGRERMLNFFVSLGNLLRLPILLVGTFKAIPVLSGEFRQIRRCSGQGDFIWEPMRFDGVWATFLETLWDYQYTVTRTPLTPELSACLYDVTYGITDFVIKVFMLAQVRAITTGLEVITEEIIRSVAHDSMRLASPVIKALRTRDWKKLGEYEDIQPINLDSEVQQLHDRALGAGQILSSNSPEMIPIIGPDASQSDKSNQKQEADFAVEKPITPKLKNILKQVDGLVALCSACAVEKIAPHMALKTAGFIRQGTEFFGE
jgi:hypothetical protein